MEYYPIEATLLCKTFLYDCKIFVNIFIIKFKSSKLFDIWIIKSKLVTTFLIKHLQFCNMFNDKKLSLIKTMYIGSKTNCDLGFILL